MLAAILDGFRRAASAPAVLFGTLALTLLFSVPLDLSLTGIAAFRQYAAVQAVLPFGGALFAYQELAWVVVWAFFGGGILDRYARNRPTRGRGFFGASGACFPAMLRLGLIEWLVGIAAIRALLHYPYITLAVTLALSVFFLYARVRLVVEDRRSAVGSLLAGVRFIRRNAEAAPLVLLFAAVTWLLTWSWSNVWARRAVDLRELALLRFAETELVLAVLLFAVFASWAAAIAFFQSRLAHASYTAGPPLVWPESPAAEAIANLTPTRRS